MDFFPRFVEYSSKLHEFVAELFLWLDAVILPKRPLFVDVVRFPA